MDTQETDRVSIDEIYRQQYTHFSKMNDLLYKLPIIFSTIIGGLWYFGANMIEERQFFSSIMFGFAAICCIAFFLMMKRFGAAFRKYIDNLNKLDREYKVTIKKKSGKGEKWWKCWRWSSIKVIMFLLVGAFLLSMVSLGYTINF